MYTRKLNVAFNGVARYVFGVKRHLHVSEYSFKIFNMSFKSLLNFKSLYLLHKILITKEPIYLNERIKPTKSKRNYQIVPIQHKLLISERQFFINTIRLWNSLPNYLKSIQKYSKINENYFMKSRFKCKIK